jgi:hypothetical protein
MPKGNIEGIANGWLVSGPMVETLFCKTLNEAVGKLEKLVEGQEKYETDRREQREKPPEERKEIKLPAVLANWG